MFAVDGLFKILDYEIHISFNAFGRYFFYFSISLVRKCSSEIPLQCFNLRNMPNIDNEP